MNKKELIDQVVEKTGTTQKDAGRVVDAVLESVAEALAKEEEVRLVGFGTFKVTRRAGRTGRNPATGELITIPASKAPVFKAGKELKVKVN